jgi:hypothetical protein
VVSLSRACPERSRGTSSNEGISRSRPARFLDSLRSLEMTDHASIISSLVAVSRELPKGRGTRRQAQHRTRRRGRPAGRPPVPAIRGLFPCAEEICLVRRKKADQGQYRWAPRPTHAPKSASLRDLVPPDAVFRPLCPTGQLQGVCWPNSNIGRQQPAPARASQPAP